MKRNRRGNIAESALCLFILTLFFAIPSINVVMMSFAVCRLQLLVNEVAKAMAETESRASALGKADSIQKAMNDPVWSSLHHIEDSVNSTTENVSSWVTIVGTTGNTIRKTLRSPLPAELRPDFQDNRNKYMYFYNIQVNSRINPFFNLSAVPVVGQTPVIGKHVG